MALVRHSIMQTTLPPTQLAPAPESTAPTADALQQQIKELREQLRHAHKLASLGTNSAMLAHEYNNVFTPVISYAQHALDRGDTELMKRALTTVLKQYEIVRAMSDRIMGFARPSESVRGQIDFRRIIEQAVDSLGRDLAKYKITISVDIPDSLRLEGDPDALQQVFFNLILNARQALLGRGGKMKISATPLPGKRAMIHVRDTGCGIDSRNLAGVFEPFYSTKQNESRREKRGLGLGLAICKQIIEEHGGTIEVESIEGHGTTFTITLPTAS